MDHESNKAMETTESDANTENISWPAPLLDGVCAILAQKWIVISIVFITILLGTFRLIKLPKVYTASAVAILMSREKPLLDATIDTSSIETSDDRAGRSDTGSLMLPANPTLYSTLIKSRAVMSQIALKFGEQLAGHLSPNDRSEEVVGQLKSMVKVSSTDDGLLTVTVTSINPQLSADIANELFKECQRASKEIERQLILQQTGHLEDAYQKSIERLSVSETRLMEFTAKNGLIDLDMQASNQLRSIRECEQQRDNLVAELEEKRLNYSENSYEIRRIKSRIESINTRQKVAKKNIIGSVGESGFGSLIVAHESLNQRVRFERDLVATLATKADIYRIRAEQPTGNLAVIRPATPPTRPSGPSKKRELGLALGASIFLALAWSIGIQQWNLAQRNTYLAGRLDEIKNLAFPRSNRTRRTKTA